MCLALCINMAHARQGILQNLHAIYFFSARTLGPLTAKVNKSHVSLCISCVKKSRECRRCWCRCVHVDELEHRDAFLCPGERLHSVSAAHNSVAEQGGPGGGAKCSTVKRGLSAC